MFSKGQLIEILMTDTAEGQKCFGRLPEGLGVFVEGPVATGDRVRAEIRKIKKNYLEARLVSVLEKSAQRVEPVCSHFGVCGGCKWQHVDYAEQLRIKRKLVDDALQHIGGFSGPAVKPTHPSPKIYGYRNKVEFSFSDRRFLLEHELGMDASMLLKPADYALGFHAAGRYDKVIDIDRCHIATDEMNVALNLARGFFAQRKISVYNSHTHEGFLRNMVLRQAFRTGEFMVYLVTSSHDAALMNEFAAALLETFGPRLTTFVNGVTSRKNNVARGEQHVVLQGRGSITEQVGGAQFVISPDSFFQTNTEQAEWLYSAALEMAGLRAGSLVYDLYCGTGTIAILAAATCRNVIGFEMESQALADAAINKQINRIENCEFRQIDMQHFQQSLAGAEPGCTPDVVITDPPRAGMHPKAVEALCALRPATIVYVSCNPASLARDARMLADAGGYSLMCAQPVDLFPHTYHVESIALLKRE